MWDVWEVKTSAPGHRRIQVPAELQAGWLAFQCGEERRRLAPLPIGWSEMSDRALLDLMARAKPSRPGMRTS